MRFFYVWFLLFTHTADLLQFGLIGALFFYPTSMRFCHFFRTLGITHLYSRARAVQSASWWPFSAFSS